MPGICKSTEMASRSVGPGAGARGSGEWLLNGCGISVWSDDNVLQLHNSGSCPDSECTENL